MKRRKALGTVLLAVGLGIVIASATPQEACAQFFDGYVPNGYFPNGYGPDGIFIPGGYGFNGIEVPGGSYNGGIVWDGPGEDQEEEEEEDLEIMYFFSEEDLSLYDTYPFRGTGGETSPDEVHRRVMDAMDELFPWGILFPWGERLPREDPPPTR
jgi:hypothetical protein